MAVVIKACSTADAGDRGGRNSKRSASEGALGGRSARLIGPRERDRPTGPPLAERTRWCRSTGPAGMSGVYVIEEDWAARARRSHSRDGHQGAFLGARLHPGDHHQAR